ncbi:hypothetical protein SEA_THUNDERCLAP_27 [Arthrobacter phage Thunderclap]|uniref:Uncharacterized protein n=10 Tax=Amigovirus amigo TaxID=1982100 RepID=A0A0U4IXE5_9CAUD|nr:hypothetical protein FDH66_gp76 [Arthrobacter phage Amigo]ALY08472.1 hypothetical protein ANANSI_27 [Arthrobacter phage Anansi]ALY09086.1 hypothetical protein GORGEOUS_27 [Arthrobacter phage Gorgeous]ALY10103.1 hypothetical protein RINGS_26 [Arthrobacter phage Rings]ALY10367.1 hypothetical protein SORJUANA_27 [Arthrobacter phage SorJuana]QFG08321.1 hypothetical protein SEA_YEEZUS_26 [Arthrobacter phage Yeezus]QFG13369.1 hypothetical protein SEA_ICHOR_26 [Arthrobacter phage Ichor]QFG13887.
MATSIYPPVYTSPVGQVRSLIPDIKQYADPENPLADPAYLFEDDHLSAFLSLNGDKVKLAAASAIDALAQNEALISKKIRTEDLSTDGPAVADALRKAADALRRQQKDEDEALGLYDEFVIVDYAEYSDPYRLY